jgi:hypothetical protein
MLTWPLVLARVLRRSGPLPLRCPSSAPRRNQELHRWRESRSSSALAGNRELSPRRTTTVPTTMAAMTMAFIGPSGRRRCVAGQYGSRSTGIQVVVRASGMYGSDRSCRPDRLCGCDRRRRRPAQARSSLSDATSTSDRAQCPPVGVRSVQPSRSTVSRQVDPGVRRGHRTVRTVPVVDTCTVAAPQPGSDAGRCGWCAACADSYQPPAPPCCPPGLAAARRSVRPGVRRAPAVSTRMGARCPLGRVGCPLGRVGVQSDRGPGVCY